MWILDRYVYHRQRTEAERGRRLASPAECDCGRGMAGMVHVESASRQPLVSLALERGDGELPATVSVSRRNRTLSSPSPDTCWRLTADLGNLARWSHSGEPDRV